MQNRVRELMVQKSWNRSFNFTATLLLSPTPENFFLGGAGSQKLGLWISLLVPVTISSSSWNVLCRCVSQGISSAPVFNGWENYSRSVPLSHQWRDILWIKGFETFWHNSGDTGHVIRYWCFLLCSLFSWSSVYELSFCVFNNTVKILGEEYLLWACTDLSLSSKWYPISRIYIALMLSYVTRDDLKCMEGNVYIWVSTKHTKFYSRD